MKAVILAGGLGTRLSEETSVKPKPLAEIGGKPILWHIMKMYSTHNINDFVICLGYKGNMIKEYFANYFLRSSDVSFNMRDNSMTVLESRVEPWNVTLIDTGDSSMTGGRLKRVAHLLDEDFCFTYGDGVSDVNISDVVALHHSEKRLATVTAVQAPGRFGAIQYDNHAVTNFVEKPRGDGHSINGGFFVLSPKVMEYIEGDDTIWEQAPMRNLAKDGEMSVYHHQGFWQPMDTLHEKNTLESLWQSDSPPWKTW